MEIKHALPTDPEEIRILGCLRQIRNITDFMPEIAIVLGSGLGPLAEMIQIESVIPYNLIKGMPQATAPGHEGRFIMGTLGGKKVICMQGRIHLYEGYSGADVALPIRLMMTMGAKTLILTNAVGAVAPDLHTGDIVLVKDHISLFVKDPLIGPNKESMGERFPDMSKCYDEELRGKAMEAASELGTDLKEGVLVQKSGPCYETLAEHLFFRQMGATVSGMSTVVDAIIGFHCGMKVCTFSCVTAEALDSPQAHTSESSVIEAGMKMVPDLLKLIDSLITKI